GSHGIERRVSAGHAVQGRGAAHRQDHDAHGDRRAKSKPPRRENHRGTRGSSRYTDEGGVAMATISKVRTPRALARTARWAEPGSKSAALSARAQSVFPGGTSRTPVYMAPYPPYAAAGEGCWITDVE